MGPSSYNVSWYYTKCSLSWDLVIISLADTKCGLSWDFVVISLAHTKCGLSWDLVISLPHTKCGLSWGFAVILLAHTTGGFVLTSFPLLFKNSISSGVKLVMEIDLTRCGGFNPRLKQNKHQTFIIIIHLKLVHIFIVLIISLCVEVSSLMFHTSSQLLVSPICNQY